MFIEEEGTDMDRTAATIATEIPDWDLEDISVLGNLIAEVGECYDRRGN